MDADKRCPSVSSSVKIDEEDLSLSDAFSGSQDNLHFPGIKFLIDDICFDGQAAVVYRACMKQFVCSLEPVQVSESMRMSRSNSNLEEKIF